MNSLPPYAVSLALLLMPFSPACARFHVHPHASLIEEYDSNITFVHENEISDYINRVELGLDVEYEGKGDSVYFKGYVFRKYFDSHPDFNNTSRDISLNLDHDFSRYDRISLSESYVKATEPRSLAEEFGRFMGRYDYTNNSFDLTYTHDFTSRLSGKFRYGNQINKYTREDLSDSMRNYVGGGAEFALDSRTIGILDYRYAKRDYDPGGVAISNTLSAGFRHYFSSQLSLEALAGYEFLETVDSVRYTNPVYIVTLSDEVTDKLKADLSYRWETSTSAYSTDVFDNHRWSLKFIDQVNSRLKVDIQGFYGNGSYEQADTREVLRGASVGFLYELFRHVEWTGLFSFSQQTSNVETNQYERMLVSSGIRIEL